MEGGGREGLLGEHMVSFQICDLIGASTNMMKTRSFHMSHGQNSLGGDSLGIRYDGPFKWATRLYVRSFDHGSYRQLLVGFGPSTLMEVLGPLWLV